MDFMQRETPSTRVVESVCDPIFDWRVGTIPESELLVSAVRSGGPGGQGVNTTSSHVEVRWCVGASSALSDGQKEMVRKAVGKRLTKTDELIFTSQSERSQFQNKKDSIAKLNAFVREALTPEEERIPTRKSRSVRLKERRLRESDKRRRSGRGKIRSSELE